MRAVRNQAPSFIDRKALYLQGAQMAASARQQGALDPFNPICVYDLSEALGVTVRFTSVSMEGMYDRLPKPRIHISALRPSGRRAFTCAHELGHHQFGHGTTIDRLQDEAVSSSDTPDEILANAFAANLLMPAPGIRKALSVRNVVAETASPAQLYAVSCNFGVGYRTFLEHLHYSLSLLSVTAVTRLRKWTPKNIRSQILQQDSNAPLHIIDLHWAGRPVDAERGDLLLCPPQTQTRGDLLSLVVRTSEFSLHRCEGVGLSVLSFPEQIEHFLRVQPERYVGLSRFRHLEEVE
jgi:Zn-dependent peptidase ImmA (M78 family)